MKLAQIKLSSSWLTAAIVEKDGYRPINGWTVASLIGEAERRGVALAKLAGEMAAKEAIAAEPAIPVAPSEVWACGCTYAPSAEFRDSEHGTREGMYAYVHKAENRPEIFFKGTARVCVGPGEPIGIRWRGSLPCFRGRWFRPEPIPISRTRPSAARMTRWRYGKRFCCRMERWMRQGTILS